MNDVKKPKIKTCPFAGFLLVAGLIVLTLFLSCNHGGNAKVSAQDTAAPKTREPVAATGDAPIPSSVTDAWGNINHKAPKLNYAELENRKEVEVRGTEKYAIYDLGEDIIFDEGKSVIRKDAARSLESIAASIKQRFPGGPIRLYGFANAQGSMLFNKQLAAARAEAVRNWLVSNKYISAEHITIEAVGAANPKRDTEDGKEQKQNRRVQVVVQEATPQ